MRKIEITFGLIPEQIGESSLRMMRFLSKEGAGEVPEETFSLKITLLILTAPKGLRSPPARAMPRASLLEYLWFLVVTS